MNPNKFSFHDRVSTLLRCIHCDRSLSVFPVYMNEDETFVCGRCPLDETKNPVRQLAYEYVAKQMQFQCSFNKLGCPEELFPSDLVLHEASCMFRQDKCMIPNCPWTGAVNDIENHFKFVHPQLIFNEMVEISTIAAPPETVLIVSSNKIFKLVCKTTESKVNLSVAFVGKASKEFKCSAVRKDEKLFSFRLISGIVIQPDVRRCDPNFSFNTTEKHFCISVNEIERAEEDVTVNAEVEQVYDNILEILKCAVCTKSMVPPIVVCSGYSTCSPCAQKSAPNHDISINMRNFNLEKLTANVRYYCQFKDCRKKLMGSVEKVKHEKICSFTPLNCTLCNYSAVLEEFIDHLKQHSDHVATNYIKLLLNNDEPSTLSSTIGNSGKTVSAEPANSLVPNNVKQFTNNETQGASKPFSTSPSYLFSTTNSVFGVVSTEPSNSLATNNVKLFTRNDSQGASKRVFARPSHSLQSYNQSATSAGASGSYFLPQKDVKSTTNKDSQSTTSSTSNYYMIRSQCVFEFEYTNIMNMHRFALYLRGPKSCNDKFDFILTLKSDDRNNNMNMKFRMPCAISEPGCLMLPDSLIESFIDDSSLPVHVDIIDKSCQMFALV